MTESLATRLARLGEMKANIARLQDEFKAEEASLLQEMRDSDRKRIFWPLDNEFGTASVVESSTIKIDEAALLRELSEEQVTAIQKTVVDQKMLEHEVATGNIDIEVVSRHSTEVPRKPYLRFGTAKETTD